MCTVLSLPCGGVARLLASRAYGGTPRGFSCPGQDVETLAPDVLCRIRVGVGFMGAIRASEYGLARSVACEEASEARVDVLGSDSGATETGACSAAPAGEA